MPTTATSNSTSIDVIFEKKTIPCWWPVPTCVDTLSDIASSDQFDQKWKNARFLPWRFFYIDYAILQQEIAHGTDGDIIVKRLHDEWMKVYEFYTLKRGEIDRRIVSFQDQQKRSTTTALPSSTTFKALLLEILELYRFAKLNYRGFLQLVMQFDQLFSSSVVELRRLVIKKPFWTHSIKYHRLAVEANFLYMTSSQMLTTKKPPQDNLTAFIHTLQQDYAKVETDPEDHVALPQQQTNASHPQQKRHTYWVHPNNVLEVMLYLSDKMRVVVDDGSSTCHSTAIHEIGYSAKNSIAGSQHHKVTTLYLDTPQLTGYQQRLAKQQDTVTTRVRWYDSITTDSSEAAAATHAMMEQKVYAAHIEQCCVQQRVWLKTKHVQPWLRGSFSLASILSKNTCQYHINGYSAYADGVHEMEESCLAVETRVHTKQLVPALKVTQNRTVYKSLDHSMTISIDSDIAMMRAFPTEQAENATAIQQASKEEHYPYNGLCSDDIVRFPYCVVQIMTTSPDTTENNNPWLMDFMKCDMLTSVDGFSAYLHGVGVLFEKNMSLSNWTCASVVDAIRQDESLLQRQTPPPPPPPTHHKKQPSRLGLGAKNSLDSIQTISSTGSSSSRSNSSSSRNTHAYSTDTIATIITCYDDQVDEKRPAPVSSSPTVIDSPLLTPQDAAYQQRNGMRPSFDSYCSFDHPTSSRSDPTNCKSCIGSILFVEQSMGIRDHLPTTTMASSTICDKETVTFRSFLLQTFWPRKFKSFEKEPLLAHYHNNNNQRKRYRSTSNRGISSSGASFSSSHSSQSGRSSSNSSSISISIKSSRGTGCDRNSRALGPQKQSTRERFSRAAILTMACVILSCILYITILSKL